MNLPDYDLWLDSIAMTDEERERMAREYEAEQCAAARLDALLPDDMKD